MDKSITYKRSNVQSRIVAEYYRHTIDNRLNIRHCHTSTALTYRSGANYDRLSKVSCLPINALKMCFISKS
ncbi:MAG: hypothetical protein LWX51_13690 [Deltaproteobacteria bacterium]|jgi:hypothetical protein|nr:hypothetical protein [Deltaproteobacteria bacterium]